MSVPFVISLSVVLHPYAGKDWLLDSEVGSATPETGMACLAMLAVDSLLGVISALEGLTDSALEAAEAHTEGPQEPQQAASEAACVAMVAATWQLVLPALGLLLGKASGEVLVLKLLRVRPGAMVTSAVRVVIAAQTITMIDRLRARPILAA